jgi:hypothetical protein
MANIDRIVNVQISLQSTGINKKDFSTILVVGPHVLSLPRVSAHTSASDMLLDGFKASDPLYLAVADAMSQTPRPRQVKVGRRQVDAVTIQIDSIANSTAYVLKVLKLGTGGETTTLTYTFTSDTDATAAEIAAGLQALVDADSTCPVDASVSTSDLVLTNKVAGTAFAIELPGSMSIKTMTADDDIAEDLAAINQEDNAWYGFGITSRVSADIQDAAAWAEANQKLFGYSTAEAGAISAVSTTDTPYLLKESNYYRSFGFYHANAATDFPEIAAMARCFAVLPGGESWANKKLAGVTTDRLTETQFNAAKAKNCNTFESFRDSVSITQIGKTAAGEWIDVIRFRDWLEEEIKVNIFNLLINRDKVPYTDNGIACIEAKIAQALELGQRRGGIAPTEYDEDGNEIPGYVINVPLSSQISANTKASRVLEDLTFTARLSGAIHIVEITGSLAYEL